MLLRVPMNGRVPMALAGTSGKASFLFDALNSGSIFPGLGGATPTYTNATIRTVTDQDSVTREVLANEARFGGFRRVRNLVAASENNTVGSTNNANITAAATTIQFNSVNASFWYKDSSVAIVAGTVLRMRASISCTIARNVLIRIFDTGGNAVNANIAVTTTPQIVTLTLTTAGATGVTGFGIENRSSSGATDTSTTGLITFTKIQFENVTGQTNQNPAEYVSVGVLSAPYQGANVDGAQDFNYLNGNTVASNVVTEATGAAINGNSNFGSLPGVSGSYFSTPDSPANSITGDIDIRVKVAMPVWASGLTNILVSKLITGGQYAYEFYLGTTGLPVLRISSDGSAVGTYSSTAIVPFSNATAGFVRVTRVASSGDIVFYTSSDGITWIQLGTTVASAASALFDSNTSVYVGQGGANPLNGKIYRAQIYNGINSTLAVDFNPNSWTSGGTWVSATGETWTINGSAAVIPISLGGYLSEPAATDLLLARADARDMTTANWTLGATMTRARTSVGADGVANKATRLTGGAVAATNIITTTITAAASSRTYSVLIKRVTGTGTVLISQDNFATSTDVTALINSSTFTLVQMVQSQLNAQLGIKISTNADAIDADWNQFSAGDLTGLINSRIPDTITTRNADVLTYATTGWLNAAAGTLYAEWFNPSNNGTFINIALNDNTTNNRVILYASTTTGANMSVDDGGVSQALIGGATITGGSIAKQVGVYQANDFATWANNTAVGTDATGTVPTVTQLQIGNQVGSSQLGHYIRKVAYYPARLPDARAKALTV